jgi:hypothetical protein
MLRGQYLVQEPQRIVSIVVMPRQAVPELDYSQVSAKSLLNKKGSIN